MRSYTKNPHIAKDQKYLQLLILFPYPFISFSDHSYFSVIPLYSILLILYLFLSVLSSVPYSSSPSFSCLTLPLLLQVNNTIDFTQTGLRNAFKLSLSGQSKNIFCPSEQSKKVCLRDTAGQPPGVGWAEGSSLHFLGRRGWLSRPPCCPLDLPSFHQQIHYGHIVAALGGVCGFLSRAGNKGILLLTYFNSFQ